MKKLLALLLVLVLSLGVLTACGGKDEEALAGAAEYLDGMYKENNGEETPRDYNVVGKIIIDEKTFTVTWTTDSDKISVTESTKAGFWTIDVPEANAEAFTYKITAKIANEKGDTVEKTFTKTMPVVTKNPTVGDVKENTPYKFYLYQNNIKTPLFATHTIDQGKYYATTDNWDEAPDFYVEAVDGGYKFYTNIDGVKKYVNAYLGGDDGTSKRISYTDTTDSVWTYNSETLGWYTQIGDAGYIIGTYNTYTTFCISEEGHLTAANSGKTQFPAGFVPAENKAYVPVPEEAVIYQTPEEIVNAAYALAKDELLSAGHKYTLTGVITKIDSAWSDQYSNITVSIVVGNLTDKPIQCFRTTGEGAKTLMVGDTITATGAIKNYNGTVEMEYAVLESVVKKDFTDAEKLAYEKDALTVPTDIKSATTITLPATGTTFNTVAIAWEATGATIENGKINVTLADVAIEFTLKATLTCGSETAVTKEFTVKVAKAPTKVPVVVTAPVAGTAYKFGMVQGNVNNTIYYLAGGMGDPDYYFATTDVYASAIDVYLEETTGGYYLYTMDGTTKTYINMVVNDTHVNGVYEATASTVYTFDTEKGTVVATVNDELYWFGTRNDKTYTTVGPVKVSYNGFACKLYTLGDYVEPEQPGTGGDDTDEPTEITPVQPTVGNKYNAYVNAEALGGVVYITGKTGSSAWYLATSANAADAAVVYVEAVAGVDGAYYLYFMDGTTKKYIEAYERTPGDAGYGKGSIQIVETTPTSYYTYDATYKTLIVTSSDGANKYYIGTYTKDGTTYNTLSCSNYSYLNADNVGVTQFPMYFAAATDNTTGGDDNTGDDNTGDDTTEITPVQPTVGNKYNAYVNAEALGGVVYITGKTGSSAWYLATSANAADAAVVYVEAVAGVDGAYYLYFMDGTTKKYIEAYERTPGDAGYGKGSIQIVETTPTSYYTYDATYKTLIVTSSDGANKYYIGTYTKDGTTYNTLSCSNYSYLNADNVGVTQFPMYFAAAADNTTGGDDNTGDDNTDLTTPEAIVNAAYALANNATLEGGPYTLTGVVSQIDKVGTDYVTLWIVVADKTDKPLQCYHLTGTGFDLLKVGDTVTVKGEIKNFYTSYNDTKTIEFDSPSLESYAFAQTTDADKIADAKADIDVVDSMFKDGTITLPTTSARHDSVTITWAITEDANSSATLTGAELAIALADTASTLKLTATIASGSATDTLEVEIALAVKPAEGAPETDGRFTEETAYYLTATATDGTVYYFTGAVSSGKGTLTTDVTAAIKLYVDIVDGGYYVYSVDASDVKTYYYIADTSKGVKTAAEASADALLTWNETFSTLQGAGERMFALYGNSNDLRTYGASNIPGSNSNNVVAVLTLANE